MFLNFFSNEEKSAFWNLANEMIAKDGKITEEELDLLDTYKLELGEFEKLSFSQKIVVEDVFKSTQKQKILLLELLGLALADNDFDEAEKKMISDLAEKFRIKNETVDKLISWINKQKDLYNEIKNILEE